MLLSKKELGNVPGDGGLAAGKPPADPGKNRGGVVGQEPAPPLGTMTISGLIAARCNSDLLTAVSTDREYKCFHCQHHQYETFEEVPLDGNTHEIQVSAPIPNLPSGTSTTTNSDLQSWP